MSNKQRTVSERTGRLDRSRVVDLNEVKGLMIVSLREIDGFMSTLEDKKKYLSVKLLLLYRYLKKKKYLSVKLLLLYRYLKKTIDPGNDQFLQEFTDDIAAKREEIKQLFQQITTEMTLLKEQYQKLS